MYTRDLAFVAFTFFDKKSATFPNESIIADNSPVNTSGVAIKSKTISNRVMSNYTSQILENL